MDHLPDNVTREGDTNKSNSPAPLPIPVAVDLPKYCTWTNDAMELELTTYFDPNKPNLATDFGLDSLRPVIRDTEGDIFLLQDGSGRFYEWNSWSGEMWWLQEAIDTQEIVTAIMRDSGIMKKAQIWNLTTNEKVKPDVRVSKD